MAREVAVGGAGAETERQGDDRPEDGEGAAPHDPLAVPPKLRLSVAPAQLSWLVAVKSVIDSTGQSASGTPRSDSDSVAPAPIVTLVLLGPALMENHDVLHAARLPFRSPFEIDETLPVMASALIVIDSGLGLVIDTSSGWLVPGNTGRGSPAR